MKQLKEKLLAYKYKIQSSVIAGISFFLFLATDAKAQGDLLVMPHRLMFTKSSKMQEVHLSNMGKDTVTYLISFQEVKMNENGSFESITQPEAGQFFASNHLIFYPHKVKLAPNEVQVIKVQLVKPGSMAAGEYRSHMYFRAVPDNTPQATANVSSDISVSISPVFGITIPVIIQIGELNANVHITDVSLTKDESAPKLNLKFNRTGNASTYGDLVVDIISTDGKIKEVASVKGIAVYTPTKSRTLQIALDNSSNINYKSGKLRITYNRQQEYISKTIAEAELPLN